MLLRAYLFVDNYIPHHLMETIPDLGIYNPSISGAKKPIKMIKSQFFDNNSMNTKSYTYLKLIVDVKYSVQFGFWCIDRCFSKKPNQKWEKYPSDHAYS